VSDHAGTAVVIWCLLMRYVGRCIESIHVRDTLPVLFNAENAQSQKI